LGDKLYGSKVEWEQKNAIALRAVSLDLSALSANELRGLPAVMDVKGLFE
jgi:hypothetical protein